MRLFRAALLLTFSLLFAAHGFAQTAPGEFALRDGDIVVFYGDSITEQRLYTSDIELYMLTRFPSRNIRFINSGVGGDKVSGGWAGPIDLRLDRDVFAYKPTVITIMLGMNDGYYRPADPSITTTYTDGYRHIVQALQAKLPNARLTLIEPSPFDDVTRKPQWDPGYNTVIRAFGDFNAKLAAEKNVLAVDMNSPLVAALTRAMELDPVMATTLSSDRVHPGTGIHWTMAESVLKAWNAPSVVTSVVIDGSRATDLEAVNTEISQLQRSKNTLTWMQADRALPLPFPSPEVDPYLALVRKSSDLDDALDQQRLRITGLPAGQYELSIDDHPIGSFESEELGQGINLALLDTPMLAQSRLVAFDNALKNNIESMHFRLQNDVREPTSQAAAQKLAPALDAAFQRQHQDAQPVPHRYKLVPLPPKAAK